MKKHQLAAVAGLCAAVVGVVLTPAAGAGGPKPLPQAQAQALIDAPAAVQSGSSTRAVSPQEALAAASLPGATVSVAPGLSLQQAVGLAPLPAAAATGSPVVRRLMVASSFTACSANAAWHEWGTWPYQQRITDTTYWCAVYGDHVTYVSSSATGSGTLCGTDWTSSQLISGGIGYSWFVTRSRAGFSCPTVIPWVTLHPSHYEDVARNAWGSTSEVGSG